MTIWEDVKRQFQQGGTVLRLIFINVSLLLLVNLAYVPVFLLGGGYLAFNEFIENWFYLPSYLGNLLIRPWTFISYMFLHTGLMHLFFNMLILYWFGRVLSSLGFNNKILAIYILSGIAGGLFFILAYNIFPVFQTLPPIVGASASVMGVVLAAATFAPRTQVQLFFVGRIELQYLALFLILLDIIFIPGSNPGGRFAHLGGALMGWLFVFLLRRGRDLSLPINKAFAFLSSPFNRQRNELNANPIRRRPQPHVAFGGHSRDEETQQQEPSQFAGYSRLFIQTYRNMSSDECVDAILDKIRRSGYNSLTEDEKAFLDKSSKG